MRKVKYSRTTDKYVSLNERARLANACGADAFYSIHANSFSKITAKGVETFSFPRSSKGKVLAKGVQDSILSDRDLYTINRGIKTANFAVLRLTKMPASLVELAFISNVDDAKILRHKQKELARKIADTIIKETGSNDTIFLDAGHGGSDPGAIGNGMREKDITLAVTLEVGRLLKGGSASMSNNRGRSYMLQGDTGNDVKRLQADLNKLGDKLTVDGSYGPATKKAVTNFQRKHKLKVDGSAGIQVFNKIKQLLKPKPSNTDRDLFYRVVTGSFNDRKNAEERIAALKKVGFESFIDIYKK